jgi:hypothetical protein
MGALGPYNLANAVIGRAWTLMSIVWGYARRKRTFWTSQGNNYTYNNLCMAENEERSVWEPLHVRRGFKKEESTVSIFQGWSAINSMGAAGCVRPAQEEMLIIMQAFPCLRGAVTLVMDPLVARHLKEQGFEHPDQLAKYLSENFKMPAGQFWSSDVVYSLVEPSARAGVEPFASWLKLPADELIAPYGMPEFINVVVVGGETQALWFTTDMWYSKTMSVDKWRPKEGVYKEDERTAVRRAARQKRHAAMLSRSGYEI